MKYIKSFKLFEAIIVPETIKLGTISDMKSLKSECDKNGISLVHYDEFLSSLPEEDKKTAPPKGDLRTPFFALFHPVLKQPQVVINCDPGKEPPILFNILNDVLSDIIYHELVHKGQLERRSSDLKFILPSPEDKKSYFSNKDEIMAFSLSIAKELIKINNRNTNKTTEDLINDLNKSRLWLDIKNVCDTDIVNRYKKYIYNYLNEFTIHKREPKYTEDIKKDKKYKKTSFFKYYDDY